MGKTPDFYEVLNLPKTASNQDIRRAYKELVKKWHPDKHPPSNKEEAEARFKSITQAYEALHDQQYRSMFGVYNEVGSGGERAVPHKGWGSNSAPPSPMPRPKKDHPLPRMPSTPATRDFKDVYFSTPAFASAGSMRRKPPPVERKLECTLEELSRGCKKEIEFTRDIITKDGLIVQQQETQTIRVKPGWKKGTKITFEGMGDERPGCLPADVVYMIAEKEHPVFKRVGNDLVLKAEIPLVNALTGWTFTYRLLTGEKMSCTFDQEIVYPGYEKVIEGQGMPLPNEKGAKGDLRIKFNVVFPKRLSKEQRVTISEVLNNST